LKLPLGKISTDILKDVVFKNLGVQRDEVVLGPSAGIDGAIVNVGSKSIIASMDPITAAIERIGWLAVNVNANDIATFGVQPTFLLSCILLPENAERETVETISTQMNKAAKDLGIAIIGGHCEVTPRLTSPIVIGCTIGVSEKGNYVTAGGAKSGDKIILTKSVGIEGTAILAWDRERILKKVINARMLSNAKRFYGKISIVKDAITAFRTGGVHAMHDPTEGGLAGGIHEMADASGLGARIFKEEIRIQPETGKICKFFQVDPLQLIASGSLLIACRPNSAEKTTKALHRKKIPSAIIGEFLPSKEERTMIHKDGTVENLVRPTSDHLWQALETSTA
jgi:hydrogenase expression/formation protein HypE